MITFQPTDVMRILPEIILCGFGILVMVLDPFVAPGRRSLLGWLALVGVLAAAGGTLRTSDNPGLAFGRSIAADHFSFYFFYLFLLVALLTVLGSINYLERDSIQHGEFYALILLGTAGMCFMASSTDLIMVFIGLEISSISTYILAGFKRKDALSNEASLKYFLLGSFATAFFLYGIAFVYGLTGTTNLLELSGRLAHPAQWTMLARVALLLMFVGLAFKLSTVPFQIWTPDVYQGAPAPVTAFLSVGPKAAAFAVLLRILRELVLRRFHKLLGNLGLSDSDHVPGQSCGPLANEHQEAAGILGDCSRRLRFGRCGCGKPRGHIRRALLPHGLCIDECGGICIDRPLGRKWRALDAN